MVTARAARRKNRLKVEGAQVEDELAEGTDCAENGSGSSCALGHTNPKDLIRDRTPLVFCQLGL